MLEGARGVGKTTTAEQQANSVFRLEHPDTLDEVAANPDVLLEADPPVLIDEWQRYPQSIDLVRMEVDRDSTPGRFILTGTPSAPRQTGIHTGAGRLLWITMSPMSLSERGVAVPTVSLHALLTGQQGEISGTTGLRTADYAEIMVRSGYPGILDAPEAVRLRLIADYVRQLVRRDVSQPVGRQRRSPAAVSRWLTAYAKMTATEAKFEAIRDLAHNAEGQVPARSTVEGYRTALEDLGVVDELLAWDRDWLPIKHRKTSPVHHLVDPALAVSLIGESVDDLLVGSVSSEHGSPDNSLLGRLFQSLVTQSVRVYASAHDADVFWLGTRKVNGKSREVDIIVEGESGVVAIEVKLSAEVSKRDRKHLYWLRDELDYRWSDGVVITTGPEAYRDDDGIAVVPAALLGP